MSAEWGSLREPTLPAPEPSEVSDVVRRAARSGDSNTSLSDDYATNNDHLSVEYGGETWLLPGGGEPGDSCQEWRPRSVCDECGHVDLVTDHCDRWECPHCDTRVMNRFAVNAARRIQAFRYQQPDNHLRQWGHSAIELPEGEVTTKRELFEKRSKVADIAKEKGFRGCAVVAHAKRATELGKQLYRATVDRDDDGDPTIGFWVWLRNESDELEVETGALIEWSPHYHVIGPTSANMTPGKESDDFMYHVIRFNEHELRGVSTSDNSHREVFGTFRYLASHILQPENCDRQMITWHGALANSVFVEDATRDFQHEKPSEGVRQAIKRRLKEIAGPTVDDEEGGESDDGADDLGNCPCDGCDGLLISVWDITEYLNHVETDPPPDVLRTMRVCRDWVKGEIELPPGLKNPSCERDARKALDTMVG